MNIKIFDTKQKMAASAASDASHIIKNAIKAKGIANIILATGVSQFEVLENLLSYKDIDWSKVTMFHLDEYIGLPITHPASFRKYLMERFVDKVPGLKQSFLINGEAKDPYEECRRLGKIISGYQIDVAFVGFGENGHIAFNDPPADFDTEEPYIIVDLDDVCRKQQLGEGWFPTFDDVPKKAVSMSVKQIMKSKHIICSVPEKRKAEAVRNCLEKGVTNIYPASILQTHTNCTYYLDKESASLLTKVK